MTKTSHELLKQEKKENKVIEYVKKKTGKNSILRYYVLKYCLTTGHFPETILERYCNLGRLRKFWTTSGLASSMNQCFTVKNEKYPKNVRANCVKELVEHTL